MLKMVHLENNFTSAKNLGYRYVGVLVEMPGFPKPEVIINETANFDDKIAYYKSAYDDDLNHKYSKGVKIIGFTFANSFAYLEKDLMK